MEHSSRFDRRAALKAGIAGGLAAALARTSSGFTAPLMANTNHKLLTIFLRGGHDANSVVIPYGDPGYSVANRGILNSATGSNGTFIPSANALALSGALPNPLAVRLSPALAPVLPLVNATSPRLVFLHAVGNPARTGSHFDDMRTWETAIPQCSIPSGFDLEEGWVTRVVSELLGGGIGAASVSETMQQLYRTRLLPNNTFRPDRVLPHVRALRNYPDNTAGVYSLGTTMPALDTKLTGVAGPPPSGLRALFSGGAGKDAFARVVGRQMVESAVAAAPVVTTDYIPMGSAKYPFGMTGVGATHPYTTPANAGLLADNGQIRRFFMYLRDAMALLRDVPGVNVAGIELGGFDTHSDQGGFDQNPAVNAIRGQLAQLINAVAFGVASVDAEVQAGAFSGGSLTVLVISEFGRTSAVNNSGGTDHGGSTCVWVAGNRVVPSATSGVVFNTAANEWPGLFSANDQSFGCPGNPLSPPPYQFMRIATDYRAVYGRIFRQLYGVNSTQIDQVIPGYSTAGLVEPVFII